MGEEKDIYCGAKNDYRNYLEHYGIKGQRWGVRNYQNPDGSLTSKGRERYGYGKGETTKKKSTKKDDGPNPILEQLNNRFDYGRTYTINTPKVKEAIAIVKKYNAQREHDSKDIDPGTKLNYFNRKFNKVLLPLADVAYATTALVARNIKAKNANKRYDAQVDEISSNTKVDKKTGIKLKQTVMTKDEDMAAVNPGFKNWSWGTKSNCMACTTVYDLRRKGYDAMANGARFGYSTISILDWYPKASISTFKTPSRYDQAGLKKLMDDFKTPEGGYGNLCVAWKRGGGHSMVYAVENGVPVIRDTQTNTTYRGPKVKKILKNATKMEYTRIDNLTPNISKLKEYGIINPEGQKFTPATVKSGATKKTSAKNMNIGDKKAEGFITTPSGEVIPIDTLK